VENVTDGNVVFCSCCIIRLRLIWRSFFLVDF
jgi:hypothetical protein